MADSNVNIRINAQNNASPAIKQVGNDLSKMDKAAGTAAGGISGLAKVAGAAGLVAFGVQAAQAAIELGNLGNQSIAMRGSFEELAGGAEQATAILESLQQASRNTVTEYDLMLAANRAMLLGVADSTEEFSTLMQIAQARGRAMGLSTTQAFNDIVTGLGRMSPLILDNLGIVVNQEQAFADFAATLGKSADALTDAERKQALLNSVIASSAGLLDNANASAQNYAGQGMAQLTTAWTDFRTALGESIGPILDARYRELADFLRAGAEELDRQRAAVGLTAGSSASGLTDTGDITAVLTVDLERAKSELATLESELVTMASSAEAQIRAIYASTPGLSMGEAGAIFQSQIDAVIEAITQTQAKIAELEGQIGSAVEAGGGFQIFIPTFGAMASAAGGAAAAVGAIAGAIRAVEREAAASDVFRRFMGGGGGRAGNFAGGALAGGLPPTLGRSQVDRSFGGLAGEFNRRQAGIGVEPLGFVGGIAGTFGCGGGGGGGGSIESEADKLATKLTSILNGALKSGIDLDNILPREDAIEEPARRLADIAVRGFDSPWVDYIKNTFPEIWGEIEKAGDPKQAAANILRDFEDGLRPELLDKGRAKELVKRALLGEQNTAALAAEIAAELSSELGVSLAQAQQAAAGVLGGGATGETGDGTGMDGATAATTFTDAFVGTMAGMLERFKGAGNSAGAQWGVGFMGAVEGGVPNQLIGLLVTLITPGVMANMAAGSSRTGAS